jgi:hypothetical protein
VRKAGFEAVSKAVHSGNKFIRLACDADTVVDCGHGRPVEIAVREMVVSAAHLAGRIEHLADVVHAHVPTEAGAREFMGESPRRVVAFEHQHALAAMHAEQGRSSQAAHAGADDDSVPRAVEVSSFEGNGGALRHGILRKYGMNWLYVDTDNIEPIGECCVCQHVLN